MLCPRCYGRSWSPGTEMRFMGQRIPCEPCPACHGGRQHCCEGHQPGPEDDKEEEVVDAKSPDG